MTMEAPEVWLVCRVVAETELKFFFSGTEVEGLSCEVNLGG